MSKVTREKSKGIAGALSSIVAIAAAVEAAYPGQIPWLGVVVRSAPLVGEHGPILLAALATLYAAASSAVPAIRKLIPWKPDRR